MSEMTEIDWRFVVVDKTRKCQLTLKYVTRPLIHCTTVLLMYTNKKKLYANRIRSCFGFPALRLCLPAENLSETDLTLNMNFSLSTDIHAMGPTEIFALIGQTQGRVFREDFHFQATEALVNKWLL